LRAANDGTHVASSQDMQTARRRWQFATGGWITIGLAVSTGCSAAADKPDDGAIRWTASPETVAELGVHAWQLEGEADDATLTGTGADGATVFHAVVDQRPPQKLVIDVDVPSTWRLEYTEGMAPVMSADVPDTVSRAFAASAREVASRTPPSSPLLTPKITGSLGPGEQAPQRVGTCILDGRGTLLYNVPVAANGAITQVGIYQACSTRSQACVQAMGTGGGCDSVLDCIMSASECKITE
jgi:hypothetical protein